MKLLIKNFAHLQYFLYTWKERFWEVSKNLGKYRFENNFINLIVLFNQNNHVRNSSMISNAAKSLDSN